MQPLHSSDLLREISVHGLHIQVPVFATKHIMGHVAEMANNDILFPHHRLLSIPPSLLCSNSNGRSRMLLWARRPQLSSIPQLSQAYPRYLKGYWSQGRKRRQRGKTWDCAEQAYCTFIDYAVQSRSNTTEIFVIQANLIRYFQDRRHVLAF